MTNAASRPAGHRGDGVRAQLLSPAVPGTAGPGPGVPDGDTDRAAVIVDFLAELTAALHHHHEGEDELMWPLLLERAPMDSALILRMEEQHERIAELYQRAAYSAAGFAGPPTRQSGADFADTLTELVAALDEHLHDEEVHILPLVEQVMTVAQWEALGERGRAGMPKDRQLVFLGFLLAANTPDRGREFLASTCRLPARIAWKVMGRRVFAREYRRIYGTDPPESADSSRSWRITGPALALLLIGSTELRAPGPVLPPGGREHRPRVLRVGRRWTRRADLSCRPRYCAVRST